MTEEQSGISYAELLERCANDYDVRAGALRRGYPNAGQAAREADLQAVALRALAALLDRITEAVATDERAMTLTDSHARSSEQQYAEESIISAAVSIAAGYLPPSAAPASGEEEKR